MTQNEALKEDKKFAAILVAGSFTISLVVILVGTLLAQSGNAVLSGFGQVVVVFGWLSVAATTGIVLTMQSRMRNIHAAVKVAATR